MPAPDWSSEISVLQGAMAIGEKRVQFADGRLVEYRSVQEVKSALAYFTDLAAQAAGPKPSVTYATFQSR